MEIKKKFDFARAFQDKILALLFQDEVLLGGHIDYLEPGHFDGAERVMLATWLFDYFTKYRITPSGGDILRTIGELSNDRGNAIEGILDHYHHKVVPLFKQAVIEREFIRDKLAEFVKYQSIVAALIESKDLVVKGNVESVQEVMNKAFLVGGLVEEGTWFFDGVDERIIQRCEDRIEQNELVVPTLIRGLDTALDGGLRAGELGIAVMGPGVGKSMFLIQVAKAAILQGMAAVFYSLELYPKRLEARFDATLSGIPTKELYGYPDELRAKIRGLWTAAGGDLLLRYAPSGSLSVGAIDAHLTRLSEERDWQPQVICIDYADLIKPRNTKEARHLQLVDIYMELRNLGDKFGCPTWSVSQPTSAGWDDDLIEINRAAGAWGKSHIVDLMMSVQRDREIPNSPIVRLYIGKSREGESGQVIEVETDYSRARFCKVTDNG